MADAITITIDDRELQRDIGGLIGKLRNPKPALNEIGLVLVRSVRKNFKAEGRPTKWKPVQQRKRDKAAAAKRAAAGQSLRGHKILQDTGNLRSSIAPASGKPDVWEVTNKYVLLGTNVKYAATHQYGDKSRNIAQRQFLLIHPQDARAAVRILKRHVEKGM